MKAKIGRGTMFKGVLKYVLDDGITHKVGMKVDKAPEIVVSTMVGRDHDSLVKEFAAVHRLRPDIKKPVWHCSLSMPPGERLSSSDWDRVSKAFMERMGFDSEKTPWIGVRHKDEHDHIHIVASRIGIDGKVWLGQLDVPRAIAATQELEREFGLHRTPGFEKGRAMTKSLTSQEINMSIRLGKEPPRQKLQGLIDAAVADKPSVVELAERLEVSGVTVRANLASTGRMNGFSFEVDGVAFKGSDLGKKYTWKGLQEHCGVSYEQARDREGLQRFSRSAASDRGISEEPARAIEDPSRRISEEHRASVEFAGRSGEGSSVLQSDDRTPEVELRRVIERSNEPGHKQDGGTDSGVREVRGAVDSDVEIPRAAPTADYGLAREIQGLDRGSEHGFEGGRGTDAEACESPGGDRVSKDIELVSASSIGPSISIQRDSGSDWSRIFKEISAAKRERGTGKVGSDPAKECDREGNRVNEENRRSAREINPTGFLEANGFEVREKGRDLSVRLHGDEEYRISKQPDGHWVWCDRFGNKGGDNIALVREISPNLSFTEAVYRLHKPDYVPVVDQDHRKDSLVHIPKMPIYTPSDITNGRIYLNDNRGITLETIHRAESQKCIGYSSNGVLFIGRDVAGQARCITRRSIVDDGMLKRDISGSDKRYPMIFMGESKKVFIVEGGVDALATHDLARRAGKETPTVVVSGGANVKRFLQMDHVQSLLKSSKEVVMVYEREKSPEIQRATDASHDAQSDLIKGIIGRGVERLRLDPGGGKDMADVNLRQVLGIRERERMEMLKQAQVSWSRDRDRSKGHDLGFSR